jgi:hypothetical protein
VPFLLIDKAPGDVYGHAPRYRAVSNLQHVLGAKVLA